MPKLASDLLSRRLPTSLCGERLPLAGVAKKMTEQTIGPYRVVRKVGEGGMGVVFEAVHDTIGRRVAIKVLHPEYCRNAEIITRFVNEARAVNQVEHVGLVQMFDYGLLPDGTSYLVMELLKGETLAGRLKRLGGQLSVDETLRLGLLLAESLVAAHVKGVVHRDLKPDNVMIVADPHTLGGERTKLLDFGIAKLADVGPRQLKTAVSAFLGTPAYMSPEQCLGAALVDDRTDVYSLGVMFHEMLAGKVPFAGAGTGETLCMHLYEVPPTLTAVAPRVPQPVAALVQCMLGKDKQQRPSMSQVLATLLALMSESRQPKTWQTVTLPGDADVITRAQPRAEQLSTLGASRGPIRHPSYTRRRLFTTTTAAAVTLVTALGAYVMLTLHKPHGTSIRSPLHPSTVMCSTVMCASPPPGPLPVGAAGAPVSDASTEAKNRRQYESTMLTDSGTGRM